MTFPIPPAAPHLLRPIVGPNEIGPRNEEEQYIDAMISEALEGPLVLTDIDTFTAELRTFIRTCRKP